MTRTGTSTKPDLAFGYDAGGNRLWKKVTPKGAGAVIKTFYYLRDAQGNEMARYVTYTNASSETLFISEEHSLYGSARIGVDSRKDTLYKAGTYTPACCGIQSARRELGRKQYELTNHLGNVLASISDKKAYKTLSGSIYFEAEIITLTDYYPFGSAMQTRGFAVGGYRFGFNGKEKEADYTADNYDFGARVYDGRLGRWWSVDPLREKYSEFSTFAFVANAVIVALDPDGRQIIIVGSPEYQEQVRLQIQKLTNDEVILKNGVIYLSETGMNSQNKEMNLVQGTALVRQLNSKTEGAYTIKIVETPGQARTKGPAGGTEEGGPAFIKEDGTPGIGEGSTIEYDANVAKPVKFEGIGPKQLTPSYILLGHELLHAKHRWDGTKSDILTEYINPDRPSMALMKDGRLVLEDGNPVMINNYLTREEYKTRIEENVLRAEQKIKLRAIPKPREVHE